MSGKSVRQQFADTMLEVGKVDPKLIVLVGDISHSILQPYAQACPGRYYNVGICEPTIMSMAAGLARTGFYPVVHTIAPFLIERSFEQMKLDFCYQQLGGNIVTIGGAFDYSNLGCTHHCYGDFALMKTLPGTEIIYPATPREFDVLFRQVYRDGVLKLFRIPAHSHEHEFELSELHFGKGIKVVSGENLTLIATGPQLKNALEAKSLLQSLGWNSEIIYIHTIRPLDQELILESVKKTRRVLVIEEHSEVGGLGDDVLRLVQNISNTHFASLAIPSKFITEYGTYEELCANIGLNVKGIVEKVRQVFGEVTV